MYVGLWVGYDNIFPKRFGIARTASLKFPKQLRCKNTLCLSRVSEYNRSFGISSVELVGPELVGPGSHKRDFSSEIGIMEVEHILQQIGAGPS